MNDFKFCWFLWIKKNYFCYFYWILGVNLWILWWGIFFFMYVIDLNFLEELDIGMIWIFILSFWRFLYFLMNFFNNLNRYLLFNGNLRFRIYKKYFRFDFNFIIYVSFWEVVGLNCNVMYWDIFFFELYNVGNFSVLC